MLSQSQQLIICTCFNEGNLLSFSKIDDHYVLAQSMILTAVVTVELDVLRREISDSFNQHLTYRNLLHKLLLPGDMIQL